MSLTHPLSEISEQLEKAFLAIENRLVPSVNPIDWAGAPNRQTWFPNVEILETEGDYIVKAEMVGISPDDTNIVIEADQLILATRGGEPDQGAANRFEYEAMTDENAIDLSLLHNYGAFKREIPLPAGIKGDQVVADFTNGVLGIMLPKSAEYR